MSSAQGIARKRYRRLDEEPLVPYSLQQNAFQGFFSSLRAVFSRRELLGLLVRRELVGRYKDSALGFVWSLVRPLTQLGIYYLVMGKFLGAARGIDNFAVFIFAGLTMYGLFSEMITSMTASIVANAGLVKKVFLPREIFPIAAIGAALFNFLIQFAILLVAALLLGTISFNLNLLYALGSLLLVLVYGTGIGLALAAWNVSMRDIQYLTDVVVMLLMWFSPIVYSWTFVRDVIVNSSAPWLFQVYVDNPITLMVLGFQEAFWAGGSHAEVLPNLAGRMAIAFVIGLFVMWGGQRIFAKRQANFAQEL